MNIDFIGQIQRFRTAIEIESPIEFDLLAHQRPYHLGGVIFGASPYAAYRTAGIDADDGPGLRPQLFSHWARNKGKHQLSLAGKLAIDRCGRRAGTDSPPELAQFHGHD